MVDMKVKAKALRDECERLAREQEKRMSSPALTEAERKEAMDAAKVYWQMSRHHADTLTHAEMARPSNFTAKNTGAQKKTAERRDFLRQVAREIGTIKRFDVCRAAQDKPEFSKLFRSYEDAYRFAKPTIFDGIRKPS